MISKFTMYVLMVYYLERNNSKEKIFYNKFTLINLFSVKHLF